MDPKELGQSVITAGLPDKVTQGQTDKGRVSAAEHWHKVVCAASAQHTRLLVGLGFHSYQQIISLPEVYRHRAIVHAVMEVWVAPAAIKITPRITLPSPAAAARVHKGQHLHPPQASRERTQMKACHVGKAHWEKSQEPCTTKIRGRF